MLCSGYRFASAVLLGIVTASLAIGPLGLAGGQAAPPAVPGGKKADVIPREVIFGNPQKASPRISPDGKYLSYLAPVKGVLNVWVGPMDEPGKAKPVTKDKKRGIRSYSWAYTNRHILYTQDADGDENWRIYSVDLKTGKTRNLTPGGNKKNPKFKVQARIQEASHKFPGEILVAMNDRNPRLHDIYRLNITTGKRKLIEENTGFIGYISDDDFRIRLGIKFGRDGSQITYQKTAKGAWEKLLAVPPADSLTTSPIGFDKSGKVLYLIDSRKRNTAALTTWNLQSGKKEVLAKNNRADIAGVMLHPTERTVQAYSTNYLRRTWKAFDAAVAKDLKQLRKVADGDVSVSSRTLDDSNWIVTFVMDNGPVRFYHYDRSSKKAKFLFTNREELAKLPLQKMHPRVVKSRDGLNLVCYLTLPPGTDADNNGVPGEPMPMVLYVHGGPWARDSWGYSSTHQFLANRGYAVLSVNFRGSTGFGKKFLNAANREWAGKMHDDLIDAVDWAIKKKIARPKKVAIMGGSYGGYATLVGLTFTPNRFACGVDIVGPSNILTLIKNVPPYWYPFLPQLKDRVGDWTTTAGRAFLKERSPLTHVDKIKRPLLIGQGANDPRVNQVESDQIVSAMKKKKLPVTYVLFPDEGHGFARPANRLAFFAVTEAFLARHLGGRYEPIGSAFKGSSITVPEGADDVEGLKSSLPKRKPKKK